MGVKKYRVKKDVFFEVDVHLQQPDGTWFRFRQRRIPTREQAEALVAKKRAEAFEGRYFDRRREEHLTVAEAWELYRPITERDNDAWQTDAGRAAHLVRHLGDRKAATLTVEHVEQYRTVRLEQRTRRGRAPSPATLDREVELLKRFLNYAVTCKRMDRNPIAEASLLKEPNVRRVTLTEEVFEALRAKADEPLRTILLLLRDTMMRKDEVLQLRRDTQLSLRERVIRLAPQDDKEADHRVIYLTDRCVEALERLPHHLHSPYVFVNAATGEPFSDIRKAFRRACEAAGVTCGLDGGIVIHDLRRTAITEARRAGIPESVVMRMSGHKTRAVFDRYNIVEEDDLKQAVQKLQDHRAGRDLVEVKKAAP